MMKNEVAFGHDQAKIGAEIPMHDAAKWRAHWQIKKFVGDYPGMTAQEIEAAGVKPYETLEIDGNLLLNDGINNIIWPLVGGTGGLAVGATAGCLGVGDSTVAAVATQTALQAAANRYWMLLTAAPTYGAQSIIMTATYASAVANFVWNEIGAASTTGYASLPVTTAGPPATYHMLNRLVQAMGTKAAGTSWVATLTITLS